MLDSALLKTNFVGRDGFIWWIGRVAPPSVWRKESTDVKAGWAYRCKVRIIGYHAFQEEVLPDDHLPWAHVLVDANSGAGQGGLGESSKMVGGETVFGFFLDGEEAQQPVIFGALARSKSEFGPNNYDDFTDEANAFSPISGREAGIDGITTQDITENKPFGPGGSDEKQTEKNAKDGVGKPEDNGKKEGLDKATKGDVAFSNVSLGPHSMDNGCEDGPLSDIAHTLGSFATTVNSLTEFAGLYIDTANNLLEDISKLVRKSANLVSAAVKKIVNKIREKVMKFITKKFRNLQALIIPEPQKSPVVKALQKIMDIIFCLFDIDILDMLKGMLLDMIGKALNTSVCAIEQMIGNILADIHDKLQKLLKPILDGLDWLMGALGGIAGILGKVSSYMDMLLGFFACAELSCKEYEDWSQGLGVTDKPDLEWGKVLSNSDRISKFEKFLDSANYSGDEEDGGVFDARARFSLLSMLGGGLVDFFDCNQTTNNPKTQDQLGNSVPPGFTWSECIPPKVEVHGVGTKTAVLMPIVSSVDGSILTLEIIDPGLNYEVPPSISIIDKTRHGGGAHAEAIVDDLGRIVDIFMLAPGEGYCPSTNVVPPQYPVTEGPAPLDDGEIPPYITFTTPADDAVGVQTSTSISITFSEAIARGEGEITITESTTNVVHERINVRNTDKIIFLSDRIIKIDPGKDLRFNTEYFISMAEGSFLDLADTAFAGIAKTDTYNFTTRGIAGIGSESVGIVTSLLPYRPGIGYTSGDTGRVGDCSFDLITTPAGSIAGVRNIKCKDKHKRIPPVTINTRTGLGAELIPIISYSPDFVSDIGERPNSGILVVDVVDCVYSLPKRQVGWVNGNPYYGDFHVHQETGVKMVGPTHVSSPHAIIYPTKEQSIGSNVTAQYIPPAIDTAAPTLIQSTQNDVPDPSSENQSDTSDTTSTQQTEQTEQMDTTTPIINNTEPQQTSGQSDTPPPSTPPSGGGSSGSGGGSQGGGGYGGY